MFELKMDYLIKGLLSTCLMVSSSLMAQEQSTVDFIPDLNKGDRMVYQLVETKFRQNQNGHYLFLMYDTSYMVFKVADKNDSQILVDFNYAEAIVNGAPFNQPPLPNTVANELKTETYKIALDSKGEFIELVNWEYFSNILIKNLKLSYLSNQIDSNTLKYYYLYFQTQENVEKAVIPRVLELIDIYGKSYQIENNYLLAREIVNPFGGTNLFKSCTFKPIIHEEYPNSVFFEGQLKTSYEDNECLQEDYYAFANQKKPDSETDEVAPPYIYIVDTYSYQWGTISKKIIAYSTTHSVWVGSDKQGLDRIYKFYAF